MLCAIDFALGPSHEIVITGQSGSEDTHQMVRTIQAEYVPNAVVLFMPTDEENPEILRLAPFTSQQRLPEGHAAAYVCSKFTCLKPTSDPKQMLQFLGIK
jgi:hypothetical protein